MKNNANQMSIMTSALEKLTDEELSSMKFAMPWQYDATGDEGIKDEDGFPIVTGTADGVEDRARLQKICWTKFNKSPFVGTAVRGQVGRLTGFGFEVSSDIPEVHDAIIDTEFDPRNRLYSYWPKFVGRAVIEGELFLLLTAHPDGFIEVDFIDPANITGGGEDGVLYHPAKSTMPLFYYVTPKYEEGSFNKGIVMVPSIFMAYYPELMKVAKKTKNFNEDQVKASRSPKNMYNGIGGFQRFIVSWDRSFITHRNISYLRTVIEWLNHYENLKKYEIDHKKSSGAYVWVVSIEDPKSFRTWLSLSDEERRKTGIMAKKTPGSTLVLPPGMKLEAHSPKLPTISDSDTDILHMVTGGLNEPEDVSTGQSKGTFASVKASRGPMSDRISDEIAYFDRFLKYDFYRAIFYLKAAVSEFPRLFTKKEAVDYKAKKPVFKDVERAPEFLIDITYPVSQVDDAETRARAFLGVKHGSVYDTLGISNEEIAKKLGFGNYRRSRLAQATEEEKYPELTPPLDEGGEQMDQQGLKPKKPGEAAAPAKPGQPVAKPVVPTKKVIVKKPIAK
jgi:hypothetical protein